MRSRKIFIFFVVIIFFASQNLAGYAYVLAPEFLCEVGIKFYQQGRYDDALYEFQKALIISPDNETAQKYISLIQQSIKPPITTPPVFKPPIEKPPIEKPLPPVKTRAEAIKKLLEKIEKEREITPKAMEVPLLPEKEIPPKKVVPGLVLVLDENIKTIKLPIEIEKDKSIIIRGKNISRFLATQPDILSIERTNSDELLVSGKDIGYTYLHIWDDNGRWTTEWLTVFPKPKGPTYEEMIRKEEELARNFKLRYTLDWSSFETGRRIDDLKRSSYSWSHGLTLNGPTPYGDFDSSASLRRLKTSTDITYFTLGLTNGQVEPFKGFTLRGFDYFPSFSNLTFPGATLRGAMLTSPAFDNKIDYTAFWGREGGGRYGNLSPGLSKIKNSFLEGINLNYSPTNVQNYKFTLVHGHGEDRYNFLNHYGFDLMSNWNFEKWGAGYEIAQDSENFAHLLTTHFSRPKLNFNAELRNISKKFLSITGSGWRQGELGGLFKLNYTPTEKLNISSNLDVYRDRLYPALDNDNRWNEDFDWDLSYQIDSLTSLGLSYSLQNDLGRLSQSRYQSPGLSLSRTFKFFKDIYTYLNYYHQESKNFSSHSSDYINDRIYAGIRFSLIGELYYYLNKEINWLEVRYSVDHSRPQAWETGVDWSSQVGKTPFYGNLRFTFRDEENTISPLSFLSGEDYIEGYSELSYRPTGDTEIYGSARLRNIWADNPNINKRVEADFRAGMRYLWDTGIHWESVGSIEGYVFKDLDSDGLRQRDEAPIEGIKLWLGKDKSQVTDMFGYYKFKGVKARRAYVTLDTATLPSGFVLTVPITQEVTIAHHRAARIDFGIISRSEISGFVFEDVDGNGEYSRDDKGIAGVAMLLEDGSKSVTDGTGRYSFPNASVGEHTINLDLNSLPVYYLPQTVITKKITLFEGITYIYNIPLKRIKE